MIMSATSPSHQDERDGDESFFTSADSRLFSLFMQYPDMNPDYEPFSYDDVDTQSPSPKALQPSTPSTIPCDDDDEVLDDSFATFTTSQTTPPRPLILVEHNQQYQYGWAEYQRSVRQSKLSHESKQYFHTLGQVVVCIGHALFSPQNNDQAKSVTGLGEWLMSCVSYSTHQVKGCGDKVCDLKKLSAFSYQPTDSQLWSSIRQRNRLALM